MSSTISGKEVAMSDIKARLRTAIDHLKGAYDAIGWDDFPSGHHDSYELKSLIEMAFSWCDLVENRLCLLYKPFVEREED